MPIPHPAFAFLIVLCSGMGLEYWKPVLWLDRIPPMLRRSGGAVLAVAAVALVAWGIATLLAARTPVEPGHVPSVLVTSGPYRYTRNPLYLGQLLFLLGLGFAAFPWLLPGAVIQALLLDRLVIPSEERRIAGHFGDAWAGYARRVRRWL